MLSAFLIVFVAVIVINIFFFVLFGTYSFAKKTSVTTTKTPPVSVLICAKNEAENLRNNLPKWLEQAYPDYELIVVNDASTDDTAEVLKVYADKYPKLQLVTVQNNEAFWANKKYALTLGIKKAKNKLLLFTEPNTTPTSKHWITTMAASFSKQKQLVLGHASFPKTMGFSNLLMRFDNCYRTLFNFSFAKAGLPFSGNGKNLGYTTELFYAHRGFMSHMNIRAGEDELFVNEAANKSNTAIVDQPEAFCEVQNKQTFEEWFAHKKRRLFVFRYLHSGYQSLIGLHFFARCAFWIMATLSFIIIDWPTALTLVATTLLLQYAFLFKGFLKLKEKEILYFLIPLEIAYLCVQISIFMSNIFSKPKLWK